MFPAFTVETLRNVELLRIIGTGRDCLLSLRWVHDAVSCRVLLMLHIASNVDHLPLGLYGVDHEHGSARNH